MHSAQKGLASMTMLDALVATSAIIMMFAVWVEYNGIFHDSRLYTLQALNAIDPARYGKDVFLAYGSQDQFTLFSPIYGQFIRIFGAIGANIVLFWAGTCLWLFAAVRLGRIFNIPALIALIAVVMLPMPYGQTMTTWNGLEVSFFNAREPFLTPRLYAEALCLLAIAFLLEGKRPVALAVVLLASVLHPIMGSVALLVGYVHETLRSTYKWRWIAFAIAGIVVIGIAGALGITPADRLFVVVQGVWLEAVLLRSAATVAEWHGGYAHALFDALLTLTLLFDNRPFVRRLGIAALIAAALGVTTFWIGWDELHLELILQAQPWRALWVLAVMARMALALLFLSSYRDNRFTGLPFWLFLSAIGLTSWLQVMGGLLGLAAVIFEVSQAWRSRPRAEAWVRWIGTGIATILFAISAVMTLRFLLKAQGLSPDFNSAFLMAIAPNAIVLLKQQPGLAIAAGFGLYTLCVRKRRLVLSLAESLAALVLAALGILATLQGNAAETFQLLTDYRAVAAKLPRPGDIFWEGDPDLVWIGLGRTSYLTIEQQNVVAFSRGAAMEVVRRANHLKTVDPPAASLAFTLRQHVSNHPWDAQALPRLCSDSDIAYVIADRQPYQAVTTFSETVNNRRPLFIYDCASLVLE